MFKAKQESGFQIATALSHGTLVCCDQLWTSGKKFIYNNLSTFIIKKRVNTTDQVAIYSNPCEKLKLNPGGVQLHEEALK